MTAAWSCPTLPFPNCRKPRKPRYFRRRSLWRIMMCFYLRLSLLQLQPRHTRSPRPQSAHTAAYVTELHGGPGHRPAAAVSPRSSPESRLHPPEQRGAWSPGLTRAKAGRAGPCRLRGRSRASAHASVPRTAPDVPHTPMIFPLCASEPRHRRDTEQARTSLENTRI